MRATTGEHGVAMVWAMLAVLLVSALGAGLILTSSTETMIASNFRDGVEARYAADAMMARAIDLLVRLPNWVEPITGLTRSALVDGNLVGARTLPDGSTIDLIQAVNLANCQKTIACAPADLSAVTRDRPWGANNPRWQPFAYGPLGDVLRTPSGVASPFFVLLLIADDPTGSHQRPPAGGMDAPWWEGVALRAEAFGPRGAHQVVEVVAGRTVDGSDDERDYNPEAGPSAMKILSWREVR
jgi:hypothetical protein